jgi:purine-binding chemotaxis protein CheW
MGEEQWFCLFRGDLGPMAVSVESVVEILETRTLLRLAWGPPEVVGLCPFHREVIPVVRLGPILESARADLGNGTDPRVELKTSGAKPGVADESRCVVLILRSANGPWGIRIASEGTIISRERPEFHPPRSDPSQVGLSGVIGRAETQYAIIDTETTWRSLRSAVDRSYRGLDESTRPTPVSSGAEPGKNGTDTSRKSWENECPRG